MNDVLDTERGILDAAHQLNDDLQPTEENLCALRDGRKLREYGSGGLVDVDHQEPMNHSIGSSWTASQPTAGKKEGLVKADQGRT